MKRKKKNKPLPHQDKTPPFSEKDIAYEVNVAKRHWMLERNEEWYAMMEEEDRGKRRRDYGY